MLIHAYKRKEITPIDAGNTQIEFKPNEHGDVVAEVLDKEDRERLLGISEAFCIYGPAVGDELEAVFFVTNGDETLDLATLDDEALKEFAKANGVKTHHSQKGDRLRQVIVDHLVA